MNRPIGFTRFIPHVALDYQETGDWFTGQPWYIVNDRMYIEVTVSDKPKKKPEERSPKQDESMEVD